MSVTVAMFKDSLAHIEERLHALNLDIDIWTIDNDGNFCITGATVPPEEVSVDYVWLSQHLNPAGARETVFDALLRTKSVNTLQTFNAGLDDPFYKQIADKGVRICNSSAQGVAIAEYVLGQVMGVLQPIQEQRRMQAERQWSITRFREISKTHWLIIGFGPIGQEVAKRVKAFGASVSVIRRNPKASNEINRAGTSADLPNFLPDADVIVIACPLNAETRCLVDAEFFGHAADGAILVNVARGPIVDDVALIGALDAGRISTAILDVFNTEPLPTNDPLWVHPKVRMTPHTSFAGDGVQDRWDELFLDNLPRYVNGEELLNVFNPADLN